jgi:hypothetical protein
VPAIPLDDLPSERVWGECELLFAPKPSIGFTIAMEPTLSRAVPELQALAGVLRNQWHPEGDVWITRCG